MGDSLNLEPRDLWPIFFEICAIPHPSHHEEALASWAVERARRSGFQVHRDKAGNIVVRKPASPGLEASPGVILQAHLDMVPQKTADSLHDFLKDPILPRKDPAEPGWLRATGTTLGADDGLGVAAGFAILEDRELRHGPLELLLTLNEEDGMSGAHDLAPGLLSGRYLLNLDCEDENELGVGSAGSRRVHFAFREPTMVPPGDLDWLKLEISGGRGGHSGGEIHLRRANAIKVLLDLLLPLAPDLYLARLEGGSLANAIAREAGALVGLPRAGAKAFKASLEARGAQVLGTFRTVDPGLKVDLRPGAVPETCLSPATTARILGALGSLPDGCFSLLEGMTDVARLSSNLGALTTTGSPNGPGEGVSLAVEGKLLVRAAFDSERLPLVSRIEASLREAGAEVDLRPELAAWSPDLESPLLATAQRVWKKCRGQEAHARATHGGLECSLIRQSYPGLDMVSIGPTIRFPHSPDEAVLIDSVGHFMECARALVEELGHGPGSNQV